MSGASIVRTGTKLVITARIRNSGSTPDELLQIGSQVSPTITLSPALTIPAGGTVDLDGSTGPGTPAVLDQQGRLEPGATVDLSLQFQQSGSLQVFTSFKDQ